MKTQTRRAVKTAAVGLIGAIIALLIIKLQIANFLNHQYESDFSTMLTVHVDKNLR